MRNTAHPRIKQYVDARTGKPRYLVRYRKPDGRQTMKRGFTTKRDAEAWLADMEGSKRRGEFVTVSAGRATVGDLADPWLNGKQVRVKASTWAALDTAWRVHVAPHWASTPVSAVLPSNVQAWIRDLSAAKSPTVVIRAHGVLAGILDVAVRDRRIVANPARGMELPRKTRRPSRYLSHVEVDRVARASRHPVLVYLLAYSGLRWGEATALRGTNVDRARARVRVDEAVVWVRGRPVVGTPKSHERRTVPLPRFLVDMLPDTGGELLFPGARGEFMTQPTKAGRAPDGAPLVTRWWEAALKAAGVPYMPPHDLRHTAASLAVQSGASVKVVQRMLGHASAAMTLDVYADLFDSDLDEVAEALEARRDHDLNTTTPEVAAPSRFLRVVR
ncbi:MAG: site-specific integrase [Brachybacterium sp.]|uniref:tyrosine-type recombinase/integrase n=1 Tax=Brachybacterium sp. TaxID=1891286 RepID=UPI002648AEE5|nr:tyrosine-type recombinase/integrase [Brachybacterium sp.]MDN5687787.1 site-specific integrase [Brachybacterium sp.]